MEANATDDLPLYSAERDQSGKRICYGWFSRDFLRPLISRQEASCKKWDRQWVVVMKPGAAATARVRALSSAGATQALSTTYTEDLYPDSPEALKHKKDNDIAVTVTASVMTLKKFRKGVGFLPWADTDTFKRRRFDPDHLKPLFRTERAAMAALRPAR